MACISSTQRQRILAQIARLEAQLEKLYTTYSKMIESGVSSYKFDSGDGSQSTNYRSLTEVSTEIGRLESEIDALYRKLNGAGIANINMRRNTGNGGGWSV